MDALWIMLKNVIIFVALALPGYILVKSKTLEEKQSGALSKLLTYVGMPFLILSSTLNVSFAGDFLKSILLVAVFGIAFIVLTFFVTALLTKKESDEKRKGMMRFCMAFSNNGFLGIPLAKAVFGNCHHKRRPHTNNCMCTNTRFFRTHFSFKPDTKA